jgi:hypothetical protein
LTFYEWRN